MTWTRWSTLGEWEDSAWRGFLIWGVWSDLGLSIGIAPWLQPHTPSRSCFLSCREFNQIISLEEKLAVDERMAHRENKLTVRVRAPGVPVDEV